MSLLLLQLKMMIFTDKWQLILRQNTEVLHLPINLLWFLFSFSSCLKYLTNQNLPWGKLSISIFTICGYFHIILVTLLISHNGGNPIKLPNWHSIIFLIYKQSVKCLKKSQKNSLNVMTSPNNISLKVSWLNNLSHTTLIL